MKYVDEFRDSAKAAILAKEIEALVATMDVPADRPLHIMEVCGGHTHSIFRYGVEGMLPPQIELVHGPGCPVCVLPMGRVDDCVAIAERPEVIFATFGDAMRVPGSHKSLLQAKADGADVRMVYSPMDALALARKNPGREVVFFGLGFETTMPSTAFTILRAAEEGIGNFSVFCNHITIVPTMRAILESPDLRLDGFLGPGHVSMVIGITPYEFIASEFNKPMVVAGFEPLDILQSLWMVLKQIKDGRAEIENQYARIVATGGNAAALEAVVARLRVARSFRVAWSRLDRPFRREADRPLCTLRCRTEVRAAQSRSRRPEYLPVRRCAAWCHQAVAVQGLRRPLLAGDAARRADGFVRRVLRGLLPIRRGQTSRGRGMNIAPFTRTRPLGRLQVRTVTLAHGGGGKAMKDLIDDVFVDVFDNAALAPLEDQARFDLASLAAHGDRLAFTTDSFVVDPLVFPGGDIGKLAVCGTINDLAVGGARPLYLSCAAIIEEGVTVELLRQVAGSMARTAKEAGVAIVTGDTKVVHKGACDKLFLTTTGIGVIPAGVELGAHLARAGDVILVNGLLGDHGAAILGARGDMELESTIESDCAPLNGLIEPLLAAAPGIRFMRDATRGGVATTLNEIADASQVAIEIDETATPIREPVKGFCEILGLDPLYLANEGKIVVVTPPDQAEAALAAMLAHPLGAAAAAIGRVTAGHAGRVTMRTIFGGLPHRRHARRRAAPAHLLRAPMHELGITRNIVAIVGEAAKGRPVRRVTLEVGKLSGVMSDAIAFCFDTVSKGTPLEGAALDIREIDGRSRCLECEREFAAATLFTPCACGSRRLVRLHGEELNIKSMELMEAA